MQDCIRLGFKVDGHQLGHASFCKPGQSASRKGVRTGLDIEQPFQFANLQTTGACLPPPTARTFESTESRLVGRRRRASERALEPHGCRVDRGRGHARVRGGPPSLRHGRDVQRDGRGARAQQEGWRAQCRVRLPSAVILWAADSWRLVFMVVCLLGWVRRRQCSLLHRCGSTTQ